MSDKLKVMRIKFTPHLFPDYVRPLGMLVEHKACHALFYYYLISRKSYEDIILDPIVLEGEKDPEFNFHQLFKSIATAYGVEPEQMIKFWANVDAQCAMLQLPKLPEGDCFRFDGVPDLTTEQLVEAEAKQPFKLKKKEEKIVIH